MLVTKQLTVAIDFHSMEKTYYESQWIPSTVWLPTFKVNILCQNSDLREINGIVRYKLRL